MRVWDVETGATVFRHEYPDKKIGAVRLGPVEGTRVAVAVGPAMVTSPPRTGTGRGSCCLEGVDDEVTATLFSGDRPLAGGPDRNGKRHLWGVADRAQPWSAR